MALLRRELEIALRLSLVLDDGTPSFLIKQREVVLRFETPLENRVGQGLFIVTLCAIAVLAWRSRAGAQARAL